MTSRPLLKPPSLHLCKGCLIAPPEKEEARLGYGMHLSWPCGPPLSKFEMSHSSYTESLCFYPRYWQTYLNSYGFAPGLGPHLASLRYPATTTAFEQPAYPTKAPDDFSREYTCRPCRPPMVMPLQTGARPHAPSHRPLLDLF